MNIDRRMRAVASLVAAACILGVAEARAEFLLLLTTREVLAVDRADDTIVSRYQLPVEVGASVKGIERGDGSFYVVDSSGRAVWSVDESFSSPVNAFDLPAVNAEGIARQGAELVVNGQAPMVPPDTLFVFDSKGTELRKFAVPPAITGIKDLTSDGTHIWAVNTSDVALWRVDPTTGSFDLSHPLPGPLVFAVAWNEATGELWLFESGQGTNIVGYTLDRTTGATTKSLTLPKSDPTFVLAATFSDTVTPTRTASWSEVKSRYVR